MDSFEPTTAARRTRAPRAVAAAAAIVALASAGAPAWASPAAAETAAARAVALERYGKLPMRFEPNLGQTDARVQFTARGAGYTLFLASAEAVLSLGAGTSAPATLRMRLAGADPAARAEGEARLEGASNYILGSNPSSWRTDVPGFARVRYAAVYPGIDAVYYGNQSRLEYDFVVAPGADPSRIGLELAGADRMRVDASGDLVLTLGAHEVRQLAPIAYQPTPEGRRPVDARFRVEGGLVRFELGAYDRSRTLVIDPVLSYSTYLGGAGADRALGIAVDGAGNAYVTGLTRSLDFPLQGAPGTIATGGSDVFVTKLAPSGSSLVYSTTIGGSADDQGNAIVLDAAGNAYVAGSTASVDFPTAAQGVVRRGALADAFVLELNAAGTALAFSTILGGGGDDAANGVAIDSAGGVYIAGATTSTDYPTMNPIQIDSGENNEDAFVTKLNASGSTLLYSTYLGGSDLDRANAVAVDADGNVVVTGVTGSGNFPTRSAFQLSKGGGRDAFVASLDATGTGFVFSTFLGGASDDRATAIALDPEGNIHLAGETFSGDFPTLGPLQTNAGDGDAFVTKMNAAASSLVFSTFLGGGNNDQANAVAVDGNGATHVAGYTRSGNFPTEIPIQLDPGDANDDAFVARFNAQGSRLSYSTYLGGADADRAHALALDGSGNAYVAGATASTNFPSQNGVMGDRGADDAFVAKISNAIGDVSVTLTATPDPVRQNAQITYTAAVTNTGADAAGDVTLVLPTPPGTTFASATSGQGTCTAPPAGGTGTVSCALGTVPAGETATVTVVLTVTAPQGSTVQAVATATTTATDTNPDNNSASVSTGVIAPVDPPVITSIQKQVVSGKPYRIRINGSNFQPGVQVFIGGDTTPWPDVKYKNSTRLVLKEGKALRTKFPKGVPTPVRVVNPDGGDATATFTR